MNRDAWIATRNDSQKYVSLRELWWQSLTQRLAPNE